MTPEVPPGFVSMRFTQVCRGKRSQPAPPHRTGGPRRVKLLPVQFKESVVSKSHKIAALALTSLMASAALAADLEIKEPWVRGTVPAQKATGAFMQLSSKAGVTLVGVASPAAKVVELHEMVMDNNVMKMRAVPRLDVQPGKPVELKPGSYHVMLIDLNKPLSKGEVVPITLKVEGKDKKVENVEVKAEVRDLTAAAPMDHKHHH